MRGAAVFRAADTLAEKKLHPATETRKGEAFPNAVYSLITPALDLRSSAEANQTDTQRSAAVAQG